MEKQIFWVLRDFPNGGNISKKYSSASKTSLMKNVPDEKRLRIVLYTKIHVEKHPNPILCYTETLPNCLSQKGVGENINNNYHNTLYVIFIQQILFCISRYPNQT